MKDMEIGNRLKELRKSKGLTTKDVANRINVSQSYISRFENNRAIPDIIMLSEILEVLGTDIPSFFSTEINSMDLLQLIDTIKRLTSEERVSLNHHLQVMLKRNS